MKLIYTDRALRSLDGIYEFINRKTNKAATRIHNEILDHAERLLSQPQMAPAEPLFQGRPIEYRSLTVLRKYKILYRVEGETIYIIDVWDCRRDPESLQREIKK